MLVCGVSVECDTSQSHLFMLSLERFTLLLLYIHVHFGLFFFCKCDIAVNFCSI